MRIKKVRFETGLLELGQLELGSWDMLAKRGGKGYFAFKSSRLQARATLAGAPRQWK